MPVMVLYKEKNIPVKICASIANELARVTDNLLGAKIEMRVIETVYTYNSNEIHVEMRFRDFNEWSDQKLNNYHNEVMKCIGKVLKTNKIKCSYSFYIIPSTPPRSIWEQNKS